jgi:hypothetical protein
MFRWKINVQKRVTCGAPALAWIIWLGGAISKGTHVALAILFCLICAYLSIVSNTKPLGEIKQVKFELEFTNSNEQSQRNLGFHWEAGQV